MIEEHKLHITPEEQEKWNISPEEIPLLEELRKFIVGWAELCNELGIPAANPEYEGLSYWGYIRRELALKKLREYADTGSQSQGASEENPDRP